MSTSILAGRIAVVTGGDSGIGAACVTALAAAGADVAVVYQGDKDRAGEVLAEVARLGRAGTAVPADVGVEADVERAFDEVRLHLGAPDILVNSAGLNMTGTPIADMTADQWDRLVRVDLTGTFLTCRRFVRDLRGTGRPAAVVNITSIHAAVMRAGGADYAAAKGGQTNLTRTLALEVADQGVTVNAVAPGMILTAMNQAAMDDAGELARAEAAIPVKRAGRAEEVARLVVYLASPDAAYITGTTVTIDGGLSLLLGQGA